MTISIGTQDQNQKKERREMGEIFELKECRREIFLALHAILVLIGIHTTGFGNSTHMTLQARKFPVVSEPRSKAVVSN